MTSFMVTRRLTTLSLMLAAGLLAASNGNTAHAALLWYDGFEIEDPDDGAGPNYAPGNVGGQIGGTGSFFDTAQGWEESDAQPLSSTSLTRPGQINPSLGGSVADDECCGRNSRSFASPWTGFTSGTFYFGFFANFGTMADPINSPDDSNHRTVEFHEGTNGTDDNRVLMLGHSSFSLPPFNGNTGEGGGNMKLQAGGTTVELDHDLVTPGVQPVPLAFDGNTHFMVLKFDLDVPAGSDTVSAFLDPVGTTEPAQPNAEISGIDFSADRMSAIANFVFDGSPDLPAFDELRVADNSDGMGFANVANNTLAYQLPVPIPEPASLCLVGLGAIGLLLIGRRK